MKNTKILLSNSEILKIKNRKRLTKLEQNSFVLPLNLKEILIGLLLGDLCARKQFENGNTRLKFGQGLIHEQYALLLYELFKDYCTSAPKLYESKADTRTNKVYSSIYFETYSLPCFNEFYSLFYLNGKKIIPINIEELLTPIGLAYLSMDDGSKASSGFILNTNFFQKKEVELLIQVLNIKFGLDCNIRLKKQNNKIEYLIYITAKSMTKFKDLVTPYFHTSMLYKLK